MPVIERKIFGPTMATASSRLSVPIISPFDVSLPESWRTVNLPAPREEQQLRLSSAQNTTLARQRGSMNTEASSASTISVSSPICQKKLPCRIQPIREQLAIMNSATATTSNPIHIAGARTFFSDVFSPCNNVAIFA